MDVLIVLALFLVGGVVFFVGMALFLITVAYIFSFFTGKKAAKTMPPPAEKPPALEEKPLKIA